MTRKPENIEAEAHKARTFSPTGERPPERSIFHNPRENAAARNPSTGRRDKVICVLPFPPDLRPDQPHRIFNRLDASLTKTYGGFSRYIGRGSWLEDGETKTEAHARYEVLFDPLASSEAEAIEFFRAAARSLGERWLHIEIETGLRAAHQDLTQRV